MKIFWENTAAPLPQIIEMVTPRLVDDASASTAEMSDDMRKLYDKGRQDKAAMNKVDVNESLPDKEDEAADTESVKEPKESSMQAKEDSRDVAAEMSADSVLGKYLNRDILPKK